MTRDEREIDGEREREREREGERETFPEESQVPYKYKDVNSFKRGPARLLLLSTSALDLPSKNIPVLYLSQR